MHGPHFGPPEMTCAGTLRWQTFHGPERGRANPTLCTTNDAYCPAAKAHRTNDQNPLTGKVHLPDLKLSQFGRTTFPYVVQWHIQAKLASPSIALRVYTGLPT